MTLQEIQSIYNNTKYGILYIKITQNAINLNRIKLKKDNSNYIYYEGHHILPKSLYKEYSNFKDSPWNEVLFTAREHFICHILLMKHYRKLEDTNAYIKMSKAINQISNTRKTNSRIYENSKINLSHSEETKKKIGFSSKNRYANHSDEKKLSIIAKNNKTMLELEENGKTKLENSRRKTTQTSKNTILENGLTIEQNSQIKRIQTMKERGSNKGKNNSMARPIIVTDIEGTQFEILTTELYKWCTDNGVSRTYVIKVLDNEHCFLYETIPQLRYYKESFKGYLFRYKD